MKHTPGKWLQSHREIPNDKDGMYATQVYTEDGETIATLEWYAMPINEDGAIGTYRAENAKLIAAAPDLLEALQGLIYGIKMNVHFDTPTEQHKYNEALRNANAAIEKAIKI